MIKEYETTVSKIIYYDKKNEFLEDFREISLVGSLKIKSQNTTILIFISTNFIKNETILKCLCSLELDIFL